MLQKILAASLYSWISFLHNYFDFILIQMKLFSDLYIYKLNFYQKHSFRTALFSYFLSQYIKW